MIPALNTALGAMRAYTNGAKTASNNIANVNTTGYKSQRVINQATANGGVSTTSTQTMQTQGSMAPVGSGLAMAVSGSGYFKVKSSNGTMGFSRNGDFHVDGSGKLVDTNGNAVQGYGYTKNSDGSSAKNSTPGDIQISGQASDFSVDNSGVITANVNGQRQSVGQVELYGFNNPGGLEPAGNGVYLETAASGAATSGVANSGGFGEIVPASLEMSNVDLASESVDLLQNRMAYTAQTKTIKVVDEMMGALMDIKA